MKIYNFWPRSSVFFYAIYSLRVLRMTIRLVAFDFFERELKNIIIFIFALRMPFNKLLQGHRCNCGCAWKFPLDNPLQTLSRRQGRLHVIYIHIEINFFLCLSVSVSIFFGWSLLAIELVPVQGTS